MKRFLLPLVGAVMTIITRGAPKTDDPNYSPCNETALNITWGVDYVGGSSKFDFYECANAQNSLRTTMKSLTLYDDGKKSNSNKVTSFASQTWNWNTSEYANLTTYDNKTADAVCNTYDSLLSFSGSGSSSSSVSFKFTSCILFETYQYEVCGGTQEGEEESESSGCEIVTTSNSSLKWSIRLGQYPFGTTNDTLQFVIQLQQNGAGSSFTENTTDANVYRAKIGDFNFVAPTSAKVTNDGKTENVTVGVDCDNQGSNIVECTFSFNYYNGSLEYDPTVDGNGDTSTSNSNSIFSFFNVYVMIFVAILSVFFH